MSEFKKKDFYFNKNLFHLCHIFLHVNVISFFKSKQIALIEHFYSKYIQNYLHSNLNKLCTAVQICLDAVNEKNINVMLLVQEQHSAQVAYPLVRELMTGAELETLHLSEVSGVSQHVNVEKFSNIPTSPHCVLFSYSVTYIRTLLRNNTWLVGEKKKPINFFIKCTLNQYLPPYTPYIFPILQYLLTLISFYNNY